MMFLTFTADDPEDPILSSAGGSVPGSAPVVAGAGPGGVNLSQIIQDAFGMAGLPAPRGRDTVMQ